MKMIDAMTGQEYEETEEEKTIREKHEQIDAYLPEGYCTWCYAKMERVHLCDCWDCGAPFGCCKCPRPWKWRHVQ